MPSALAQSTNNCSQSASESVRHQSAIPYVQNPLVSSPSSHSSLLGKLPKTPIPVVSAHVSCREFTKSWRHCQQLASFIACVSSSNRPDPDHYSHLLASFLRQILERLFELHMPQRYISVDVFEAGKKLLLELTLPLASQAKDDYRQLFDELKSHCSHASSSYRTSTSWPEPDSGNRQYTVDYDIRQSQSDDVFVLSFIVGCGSD